MICPLLKLTMICRLLSIVWPECGKRECEEEKCSWWVNREVWSNRKQEFIPEWGCAIKILAMERKVR